MNKKLSILFGLMLPFFTNADLNLELPTLNLPDLGGQSRFSSKSLPEKAHGLRILRELRGSGHIIDDPEINTWIRSLGNRLTSNAPPSATPYYFLISKDQSINAFATIGGVIVINAGLILQTKSEGELAAVMAHEVAHITQRHIPRMIAEAEGDRLTRGVALLAGLLVSSKDSQAGQAVITAAMATAIHKQLAFGRDAESEADAVGLRILATAGFNPMSMSSFLEALDAHNGAEEAEYKEYLRSHPLTIKRISNTRERAKRLGYYKKEVGQSYLYMREKLRYVLNAAAIAPNLYNNKVKRYSKAQRLIKNKNDKSALVMIGKRSKIVPEALLIAQLLNSRQRYTETIVLLNPLLGVYLGNEALSMVLAQTYLSLGQAEKAWAIIDDVDIVEQTSLEYFEVRQSIAQKVKRNIDAYRAAVERNIRKGNYKSAISLLHQGIRQSNASANQVFEMQTLLSQLKKLRHKESL